MENDYETPLKSQNGGDGGSTIAHGLSQHKGMIESKIETREGFREQSRQRDQVQTELDQIQNEIQQIGRELEDIYYEMQKETDKYSQKYLDLEHRRNELRKRIIDLDFQHKSLFAKKMQETRRLEEEQRERVLRQYEQKQKQAREEREERERRRKQELDRYEQEYRQKLRAAMSTSKADKQPESEREEEKSQKPADKAARETEENAEDQLSRSRRRLRIAQIEAELAESLLRRSRVSALNAELDYLRYSYRDPYFTYSPYRPYAYYPYSAYPFYSRWWLY